MTIAIFTLLYDTSYLPGALLLGNILKDMVAVHELDIKLGILIDKGVFNEDQLSLLSEVYEDLKDIPVLKSTLVDKLVHEINRPELDKTFSKIHLWNLPYKKVLYLDSDTLPNPESNLLNLLKLEFPENKILASPDSGFPDIFNSGMFVIKPNVTDHKNLLDLVDSRGDISFDGADQGLFNQYFNSDPDWVEHITATAGGEGDSGGSNAAVGKGAVNGANGAPSGVPITPGSNWIPLPFLYNVTPNTQYQYAPAYSYFSETKLNLSSFGVQTPQTAYGYTASKHHGNKVKLIHYIGPHKPWKYPYNPSHAEWWSLWHKYYDYNTLNSLTSAKSNQSDFTTKDSLWDPSTSSPPRDVAQPYSSSFPKYPSSWDKDAKPKKPIIKSKGPSSSASGPKGTGPVTKSQILTREREKQSIYGFHPFQRPERVFESQEYEPTLPEIRKLRKKESDPYGGSVDVEKVNKKLEMLGIEE